LKLFRARGRGGGGEPAVVKAQFQRALSDDLSSPAGGLKTELMHDMLGHFAHGRMSVFTSTSACL
jgi:hypothetical protein